jgi:hypothetical protein
VEPVIVRQPLRSRSFVVLVAAAALLLAACGGGGSDDTSSPSTDSGNATTTTEAGSGGGGNGDCFTDPGPQTARVRFVNLFTNDAYPSGDIDIWQGFSAQDTCGKKLATVPYGEATDYIEVNAADESGNWSVTAYIAGERDEDHAIITQTETWKGGEQITITYQEGDPGFGSTAAAGGDQVFFEKDSEGEAESFPSVDGKGVIAISATALQYVVEDGAWVAGIAPPACLTAVGDTEGSRTNIGGTSLVSYPVAPGSVELSLYRTNPDTGAVTCSGTPDIGPAAADAESGSRTLVFAFGPDAENLDLLVLPVND